MGDQATGFPGLAATTAMTHVAIQETLDGNAVEWLEKVTDEEYEAGPRPGTQGR